MAITEEQLEVLNEIRDMVEEVHLALEAIERTAEHGRGTPERVLRGKLSHIRNAARKARRIIRRNA